MMVSRIIKRVSVGVGIVAGVLAVCGFGVSIFALQSDVTDLKAGYHTHEIMIQKAINAAHEKELQCKEMIHTFKSKKLTYSSCQNAN